MKIAIDSGPLTSGHAVRGIGMYTKELIGALERESKRVKGLEIGVVDFDKADLTKYDLVHYPYFNPFFVTLPFRKPAKVVVTIHDLIPIVYPKQYPPGLKGRLRFLIQKRLLKGIDAVFTDTEASKKDIVRFLGIIPEKIYPIHLAPAGYFRIIANQLSVRKKYKLPKEFVLYVGDVNYNKNILGLIKACKIAKVPLVIVGKQALEIEEKGVGLNVLAGPRDWVRFLFNISHPELSHYQDLVDQFRNRHKILRLGFVPDEDLVAIYNLATVYCQPSFYEGFGLPVLEAMACGTPVVAAQTQALVEIAEGAALFADPKNPRDMADKIIKIYKNKNLAQKFVKKGAERVKNYSWTKTGAMTVRFYRQILEK